MGAGTGLGLSLAKKFGAEGFKVAAISRNAEKLKVIHEDLSNLNIEVNWCSFQYIGKLLFFGIRTKFYNVNRTKIRFN